MDSKKIIHLHRNITNLVSRKKVKNAIEQLRGLADISNNPDHRIQVEKVETTYRNMIRYTAEGINDPERNSVYLRLLRSVLSIADDIKQNALAQFSGWNTYWLKANTRKEQSLTGKSIIESVDDLIFKEELDSWLKQAGTKMSDPESDQYRNHQKLIAGIFNHLWLTDRYGEAEDDLVGIISKSDNFTWYERSIFVSALTLSALRVWEARKVFHLGTIYETKESQLSERALAGIVLVLHYYSDRLDLYPDLIEYLKRLNDDTDLRKHFKATVLQAVRSRETEKISKRLKDEIIPKVSEMRPKIEEKLDLDNLLPEDILEGKNPDWSDMFADSEELYKTMEEFSKLQMEGADVYMSAFSNLKHFDFFMTFSNWFLPFYREHEVLDDIFRDEVLSSGTEDLADALYKTPFICNSDKYSLILNLKNLPSSQKEMMLKIFRMELDGLEQLRDQEFDINPELTFRTNTTQYLQDLYRFFKLSPYKNEFSDIFGGRMDIHNSKLYILISSKEDVLSLADYYFGNSFYNEALELYDRVIPDDPDNPQLFEKSGYCLQKNGEWEEALKRYRNADILEHKIWTIKKIGLCLRRMGKFDQALESYKEAERLDGDNLHTIAMIGHCYLDLGDYETALKYYFKVEYNKPDNIRIHRPIAWCYFMRGNFEQSEKYFEKLLAQSMTANDMINYGHLCLCKGDRPKAIEFYKRAINEGKLGRESFPSIMDSDSGILTEHGVDPNDLPIITDYILFDAG